MIAVRCAVVVFLFSLPAFAQRIPPDWTPFQTLLGHWKGEGHGQPGHGTLERTYKLGVGGTFIIVDNRSVYPPQKANPSGETHVDHGVIGFDRARKSYIMRQFHVEGFVNQYVLGEIAQDRKKLVWTTEAIENISPGWRARETYLIKNQNEFTEIFELAAPGQDFELYARNEFHRVK